MSAYPPNLISTPPIARSPKFQSGAFPYGVDFKLQLANSATAGDSIASITDVTASVLEGTDPNPGNILNGAPYILGSETLQQIVGGVAGVQYLLTFTVQTVQGNTLVGQISFWVQAG